MSPIFAERVVPLFGGSQVSGGRFPTRNELVQEWRLKRHLLMTAAIQAERWGYSYRNVPKRYGTAFLAYRSAERPEDRTGIFSGWNCTFRHRPKDATWPKPCSERAGKDAAFGAGFDFLFGFMTYSNNFQADDISGEFCDVQHPCHECKQMLEPIMSPAAPVSLFRDRLPCDFDEPGDERFVIREMTFGESLRTHKFKTGQR